LDAQGLVWFYEVESYELNLSNGKSLYTPDFWVVDGIPRDEVKTDPNTFLRGYRGEVHVEEVKGWWGENHSDFGKVQGFRQQHPEVRLEIVIRRGFVWGRVNSPRRELD